MTDNKADTISTDEDAIYSTREVATICLVAPRTVSKWFDSGRLNGYCLPGTMHRRIPQRALLRFLKSHGMFDLWPRFLARTERDGDTVNDEAEERPMGFHPPRPDAEHQTATPRRQDEAPAGE